MSRSAVTRTLLIASVLVSSFAGALIDRALVATPAWNALGPEAWASYSRHADLGNGLIIYPIYGIALLVLTIATAVIIRLDRSAPRMARIPVYLAALSAVGVLATTARAAPIMLGVPNLGSDSALQHAFHKFTLWGVDLRGGFAVLAFVASVWALAGYRPQEC